MSDTSKQLNLPAACPLCGDSIAVTQIKCTGCGSEINGSFATAGLIGLPVEYQKFITVFLRHRGNTPQSTKCSTA